MKNMKWRTGIGLIVVWIAAILNWQWMWGFLFLLWIIPDLFTGITYFMEPISKKDNPILYWLILISWVILSILNIATAFE